MSEEIVTNLGVGKKIFLFLYHLAKKAPPMRRAPVPEIA